MVAVQVRGLGNSPLLRIEIHVKGQLDEQWSDWFGGLQISHVEPNETMLAGPIVDQAAIYGVLAGLGTLGLRLVSVNVSETAAQAVPNSCSA